MKIISFIGPPGCGKSTQIQLLQKILSKNHRTLMLRVPNLVSKAPDVLPYLTDCEIKSIDSLHKSGISAKSKGFLAPIEFDNILFSCISRMKDMDIIILDGSPRSLSRAELFLTYDNLRNNTVIVNLFFPHRAYEHSLVRQFSRGVFKRDAQRSIADIPKYTSKYKVYENDTLNGLLLLKNSSVPTCHIDALDDMDIITEKILLFLEEHL